MKFLIIIAILVICSIVIISNVSPSFAKTSYEILDNRFYNQPLVCIYEPDEPKATEIIKGLWVSETELGVKDWQHELHSTEYRDKDKWTIEIQKVPLDLQIIFDNTDCDVEIRFDAGAPGAAYAGVHWFENGKSQIRIVYTDLEVCRTWTEGYIRYQEWCYKEDFTRSKAIGNIATHEFGHALGLEHYESDDPNENYEWSSDPYASPSVMTLSVHYDETKNKIRSLDLDKVKEIYDYSGFGDAKEFTLQKVPIFKEKKLGGFDSFFTSSSEYAKIPGNVDFVTISGKVSEEAFAKGQNILFTIVFPDGHDEERKVLAVGNGQFSVQMRVDSEIQTGVYTIDATYMGYDSETLTFTVTEGTGSNFAPKESIAIPAWIKNNAKWWGEGVIGDRDFVMGVQYLAQQKIIQVDNTSGIQADPAQEIPQWIRTNANWWSEGLITDSDFIKGIQYLAQQGIIQVN